jgi:hypothetical protein
VRLADPKKVLAAAGITESVGSLASAGHALDLSFSIVEGVLESKLDYASVIDYFDYWGASTSDGFQIYDLRLCHRFVDPDSVVVRVSADGSSLTSPTSGVIADPSTYRVDSERGLVHLTSPRMRGASMVSVTYDYGFAEGMPVPSALQDVCVIAAVLTLNSLPATPANRGAALVVNVQRAIYGHLRAAASKFDRPRLNVEHYARTEAL